LEGLAFTVAGSGSGTEQAVMRGGQTFLRSSALRRCTITTPSNGLSYSGGGRNVYKLCACAADALSTDSAAMSAMKKRVIVVLGLSLARRTCCQERRNSG
jgi:hypothetical protein